LAGLGHPREGLLLILSGFIGDGSLALGLVPGIGIIVLSGRLKQRLWSVVFLVAGILAFPSFECLIGQGGAVLMMVAATLGLASVFV